MIAILSFSALMLSQSTDSTYDSRALRLGFGPGSTGVLQGIQAQGVGGGTFVPGVDLLAAAGGDIRREYNASRRAFKRYTVLGGLSIVGMIATLAYYGDKDREWSPAAGIGLPLATFAIGWAGQASSTRGDDQLRRAIWLYNRNFPRSVDSARTSCSYEICGLRMKPGTWSRQLVRGAEETSVGDMHARLDLFASAGDSARVHYETFRSLQRNAKGARWIGLASYLGAGVFLAAGRNKTTRGIGVGLLVVGYAVGHGSVYSTAAAETELEQAIWFYNRTLP